MDRERGIEATRKFARVFACHAPRIAAIVLLLHPVLAAADVIVPAKGVTVAARSGTLNGGTLDLACTDLIVAGTLQLGSGHVLNARNIIIQPGGVLDAESGTIELGGNWSNNGGFLAGTSTVRFRDLCGLASATISDNSSFANARFVTSSGKNYVFAAGSVQRITHLLDITGTTQQPIQFRSSAPGQVASINLTGTGTQQIVHVGVTDVWATGQHLAPYQSNEGGGGNAFNWFGAPLGVDESPTLPIPTLDDMALLALAALLAGFAIVDLRRRGRSRVQPTRSGRSPSRDPR